MDTTIRGKRFWRLTAAVWDLPTLSLLLLFTVLVALYAPFTILSSVMILVWLFYIVLLAATSGKPRYLDYPWYLAWKAGKTKGFEGYWYGKFRYRFARYVSHTFRSSAGSLLVQLHSLQTGPSEAAQLTTDQVPGTRLLLRAFRLKNSQPFLKGEKAQVSAIKTQVKALRDKLKAASTFQDGYLRYLIDIYFGFSESERRLIVAQHEPTILERLDESPTLQKLLLLFLGAIVSIFVYGVLRISGVPIPGP